MRRCATYLISLLIIVSCTHKKDHKTNGQKQAVNFSKTARKKAKKRSVDTIGPFYDNQVITLGIGLIIAPEKFDIYDDSTLTRKSSSINMYAEDWNKNKLYSKYYKPDYGIMHFVCTAIKDSSYEIIANYSDVKYMPRIKTYNFISWKNYILQSYGIRRTVKDDGGLLDDQPLRINPNDSSKQLSIPQEYEMFCPMRIDNDWVRVSFDCFYNEEDDPHEGEPCHDYIKKCKNPLTGWIKWRKGQRILIDILLEP